MMISSTGNLCAILGENLSAPIACQSGDHSGHAMHGAIWIEFVWAFTHKELKIPRHKKNFLAAVVEARMSTHYLGGAEMRGECGIIAAAN